MPKRATARILEQARDLPPRQRERLAVAILETVGEDDAVARAWGAEAMRRHMRIRSGATKTTPWEAVYAETAARLRSRR